TKNATPFNHDGVRAAVAIPSSGSSPTLDPARHAHQHDAGLLHPSKGVLKPSIPCHEPARSAPGAPTPKGSAPGAGGARTPIVLRDAHEGGRRKATTHATDRQTRREVCGRPDRKPT